MLVTLLTVLVVLLAGCTGDDPDDDHDGGRPSEAEIVRSLPDARAVESAVRSAATSSSKVPEDLVPQPGLIGKYGSLDNLEQRCAHDYGYVAIEVLCTVGDLSAKRSILLWGDSRAAMWMPALSRVAEQTGYQLTVVSKLGCPPLLGVTPWLSAESRPYTECRAFNEQVPVVVDDFVRPDIVILAGGVRQFAVAEDGRRRPLGQGNLDNTWTPDPEADQLWQDGLDRSLASLDDSGAEVFVLGEAPYPTQDASVCLAEHEDAVQECAVARETGVYDEHDEAVRATAEDHGATYVSPLPWLCDDEVCPAVVDDYVVYRDTFHLNREYVRRISRALGAAIGLDEWSAFDPDD